VAVSNTVAEDGSSQVQVFGYAADGTAVEGLRVGAGGAELYMEAGGSPLSGQLAALRALLAHELALPAAGVAALSGANTVYIRPELRWPLLGRRAKANPPIAEADFAWTAVSNDTRVVAAWDAASGSLKLTSSAAADLGMENFPAFNATVTLSAAAPGFEAAAADLQVLVRPLGHTPFVPIEPGLGVRRNGGQGFECGGRLYLVGCGAQCYTSERNEAFDPVSRTWKRLPDAPDQNRAVGGCVEGKVHLVGGLQEVTEFSYNDAYGFFHFRYDPVAAEWETLQRFPGDFRQGGALVGLDGAAYVFGDYGKPQELWRYDVAAGAWDRRADHPRKVWGACGAGVGGQLYVFGGRGKNEANVWTDWASVHRYDPTTDAWTQLTDAPGALGSSYTACAWDPSTARIYVAPFHATTNTNFYACAAPGAPGAPGAPPPPASPPHPHSPRPPGAGTRRPHA